MQRNDLTGRTFDLLCVEKYIGGNRYLCRCECGNTCEVFAGNLRSGHTKSCGCLKHTNVAGRQFGKLTVLSEKTKTISGRKRTFLICRCECDNVIEVRKDSIISGQTTSCGCVNKDRDIPQRMLETFIDGSQPIKIGAMTASNKSGIVGVNWDKSRQKWQASIRYKGKKYNLGRYDRLEDAAKARMKAEEIVKEHIKKGMTGDPLFPKK